MHAVVRIWSQGNKVPAGTQFRDLWFRSRTLALPLPGTTPIS